VKILRFSRFFSGLSRPESRAAGAVRFFFVLRFVPRRTANFCIDPEMMM
jgi:hypothetical protein